MLYGAKKRTIIRERYQNQMPHKIEHHANDYLVFIFFDKQHVNDHRVKFAIAQF